MKVHISNVIVPANHKSIVRFYCIHCVALWCVMMYAYFMVYIFCAAKRFENAIVNHIIFMQSKRKYDKIFSLRQRRATKKKESYVNTECHTLNCFSFIHSLILRALCVFFYFSPFYIYLYTSYISVYGLLRYHM